ncbi:MAG: macro domain-containing protein [Chloroflexi bacterium]|nr:macro domain-containing protein [Chloroflexota bacterium]
MADRIEMDVWQGDIAQLEVDAIVIAGSESLFMTAGPAAAVKRRGGIEIERAAIDQAPVPPGSAVVTTGGMLPAPYVIHAVAVGHDRVADPGVLAQAVRSALAFAEPLQLRRIAMALLGTETGAFTPDEAAAVVVPALRAGAVDTPIESVVLAVMQATEVSALREAVRASDTGAGVR